MTIKWKLYLKKKKQSKGGREQSEGGRVFQAKALNWERTVFF